MKSLEHKLTTCPCGSAWELVQVVKKGFYQTYHCSSRCSFNCVYYEHQDLYFLTRKIDGKVFWWCCDQPFQVAINGSYKLFDCVIPYNSSNERLKTLMVFI